MKNNKMMRIAAVILMMTLLTTCAISGTFAKYVSSASASDTARVAKWSFKVGETDIAGLTATADQQQFTFNLFKTVYDTNNTSPNVNTEDDTDVANGTNDTVIIAPGTWGYFDIELKNASEVTASYTINFEEITSSNVPLKFQKATVDENDATVAYPNGSWDDLNTINVTATNMAINGSTTIRVYWQWAFDGNDGDTALGTAQNLADVTIKATITVTQVD